jgi:RNA polymerase sigma factor (sigma-70 family)
MNSIDMTDAALLLRVRAGDIDAYADLYQRYVSVAMRCALKSMRQPADAADAVSDCFTRILLAIRSGKGPEQHFLPYLLSAVRNASIETSRRTARTIPVGTDAMNEHQHLLPEPGADDSVFRSIDRALVVQAFSGLSQRWRDVLIRTEIHGQSPTEIAQEIGMSPNGVSALAARAREGLRAAWLDAHLAVPTTNAPATCRIVQPDLGTWMLGKLRTRRASVIEGHVGQCTNCSMVLDELGTRPIKSKAYSLMAR